ncbi:RagB/SusD family nutrient uptake outer membrane protein [Tamlana crocina]|uniref:RagB/SusD family nutrient uptake outer membrane protein n=1 Tax=Tamlana crocina TaxID=393006 RepID=A0ABX1DFG4_9FLAO|nr:RagB/SusD family nutrient uptake outer membrane protein [Tamlana crocina]NJX16489.1 RagB/SusD family nutrient uptake outer membrane protein [Tamlana crocina]
MKHIKFNIIRVLAVALLAFSCSNVLDETPDNRIENIDSTDKIAELLVGAYPEAAYVSFLEPMSDNAGDKGPSADTGIDFVTTLNQRMYFWEDINDVDEDTPTNYWNSAYKAIAQVNQALASIEALGGGAEYDYLKGEALLCRAYAHFMLVSIFSKSYNPSTADTDMGIPYIVEPETVLLGDYERGSVASVYQNIKADIENGLPLIENEGYNVEAFHFNTKAANAFASRFYLHTGEWEKVITHSNLALNNGGALVLRDWENEYSPRTYSEQTFRYTSSTQEPANLLLVSAESLYNRYHFSARYQLNSTLAGQLFFGGNILGKAWSFDVYGSGDLFYNVPKYQEYFKVTNQAAGTGNAFVTFVLLSTDEVLLNRAEAYAMLGQFESATADINLSLSVKTAGYNPEEDELTAADIAQIYQGFPASVYTPFYPIPETSLPFVAAILDIKRTVFYNDGLRWFDVKRHQMEVRHSDILGNVYTLTKDDNRRQLQIPEAAQSFGITPNPR